MAVLLLCLALPAQDDAVAAGRDALAGQSFPWYDAAEERVVPVLKVPKPAAKPKPAANPVNGPNFGGPSGPGFSWASLPLTFQGLALLMAVALLAIVGYVVYRLVDGRSGGRSRRDAEDGEAAAASERVAELPVRVRRGTDFLFEAERLRAAGDFGRATVLLFSHQLLLLDRRSVVRLRRGKTNRQYLREIHRHGPAVAGYMGALVHCFEDAFFGQRTIAAERFEPLWQDRACVAKLPEDA